MIPKDTPFGTKVWVVDWDYDQRRFVVQETTCGRPYCYASHAEPTYEKFHVADTSRTFKREDAYASLREVAAAMVEKQGEILRQHEQDLAEVRADVAKWKALAGQGENR